MSRHVLDTDHLSLAHHGHPLVSPRVLATPSDQLAITIITAEEQLTGWYSQIRKAKTAAKLAQAYQGLFEIIDTLKRSQILPFTPPAIQRYSILRKSLRRIGRNDLAIAAIVLENDDILLTRNLSDFGQVPGLRIEDWSKP